MGMTRGDGPAEEAQGQRGAGVAVGVAGVVRDAAAVRRRGASKVARGRDGAASVVVLVGCCCMLVVCTRSLSGCQDPRRPSGRAVCNTRMNGQAGRAPTTRPAPLHGDGAIDDDDGELADPPEPSRKLCPARTEQIVRPFYGVPRPRGFRSSLPVRQESCLSQSRNPPRFHSSRGTPPPVGPCFRHNFISRAI